MESERDSNVLFSELRAALLDGRAEYLSSGYQGTVVVCDTAACGRVVVKQSGQGYFAFLRRWMIRREYFAYRQLDGIPGIPRCHGLLDGRDLVVDFVTGDSYKDVQYEIENREVFFDRLLTLIRAMHAAGVAHGDLKRKYNLIVDESRAPVIIDFGTAVCRAEKAGIVNRWLLGVLMRADLNAWVKLKYGACYEDMSPEDREVYAPTRTERALRAFRRAWRTVTMRQTRKAWQRRRR